MSILQLPDELLLEIFKPLFATAPLTIPVQEEGSPGWHPPIWAALPKVSRRFYRLATPCIYTHLHMNYEKFPANTALLYRTLSENPELRSYCRSLQLTLKYPHAGTDRLADGSHAAADQAVELVGWLKNVKDLCVMAPFTHPTLGTATWALVRAAGRDMPQLEKLCLGSQLDLESLCEVMSEIKQLRTLEIGVGCVWGASGIVADYTRVMTSPKPEQVGSSLVTSLTMHYLLADYGNLFRLLLAPARLEHFAFKGMPHRSYYSGSLSDLISALEPHKTSLRTIQVASGRASGFADLETSLEDEVKDLDLSGFTELKSITFTAAPAFVNN
ncbi:hypothetical protein V8F20_003288 [Naviculisporaceae sp. PSN 640]